MIFLLPAQSAQPAQPSALPSKAYFKDASGNADIESLAAADFKPYAGNFQMLFDSLIVLSSMALVSWQQFALSVLGVVILNQTLATNYRAGRYSTL